MDRYEILELIGEGSFGRVYKARIRKGCDIVALKIIRKRGRSEKDLASLRLEYEVQLHLNHPNIIQMLDSFETENEIVVVTEYADKELYEILEKEGYLSEERVKKIVCDLVSALHYLHSHRILHRDLKPQNILMVADEVAKLCDFGFARNMSTGTHVLTSIKGTPLYMAPELIEEHPYDHTADLWSLGCIIYELLVGSPPFCTTSILHLVHLIKHEDVLWPDFISPDCKNFLQGLLQKDPSKRLSWPELLEHPYILDEHLNLEEKGSETPFTDRPTASQAKAKELQKQELVRKTSGQSKILAETMKKMEEYQKKVKLLEELGTKCLTVSDKCRRDSDSTKASTRAVLGDCLSQTDDNCSGMCSKNGNMFMDNLCLPSKSSVKTQDASLKSGTSLKDHISSREIYVGTVALHEGTQSNCEDVDYRAVDVCDEDEGASAAVSSNGKVMQQGGRKSVCLNISGKQKRRSDTSLLDSWLSNDNNYPIENEEWLAFLQQSMEEVMAEDVDAMLQRSFIGIVLSPLQNPGVSCRVVEYVACLLSLPFVVRGIAKEDVANILKVYLEAKVVPNLIYACKLFLRRKSFSSTEPVTSPSSEVVRTVSELSADELQALECIFLILCHLVYAEHDFRWQFCDAVAVLNASSLLQDFLSLGRRKVRVVTDLLAILIHVLRTLPENAGLVEKIVFKPPSEGGGNVVDSSRMLTHHNPVLKARSCTLLQLLSQYSCLALQTNWNRRLSKDIESLTQDHDSSVRKAAKIAVNELKNLSFFNQSGACKFKT